MEKRVYRNNFTMWDEPGKERWESGSVLGNFHEKDIAEPEYVWADYNGDGYDGSAMVVYKQEETWYSVRGSHCSCYGLEDQWGPEAFDPKLHFEALEKGKRIVEGHWGTDDKALDAWLKEATES